jgi:non-specific serine/threonine protein kinase
VAEICRRLDGIPLALELAAARARVLTPEQIAARLNDRFTLLTSGARGALPRHRTLRALIDWSYDSLPEAEAALLRRLSVFAGGWTLEAVEAVCGDRGAGESQALGTGGLSAGSDTSRPVFQPPALSTQHPAPQVLDLLDALVDRSLVLVDEVATSTPGVGTRLRYRMLETVREYARERLVEAFELTATRDRHRDWCLQMARQMATPVRRRGEWVERLERELDNLRAALAWCQDQAEVPADREAAEAGLWLAVALSWVSERRGYVAEGLRWLEGALVRGSGAPPAARARAFHRACTLAKDRGHHEQFTSFLQSARREQEKAVALARAAGDRREIADAVLAAAEMFHDSPDLELTWSYATEARELMQAVGDPVGLVHSLEWLAAIAFRRGGRPATWPVVEEWLAICRKLGEPELLMHALNAMAGLAHDEGDYVRARTFYEERLAICRELGNLNLLIHALGALGHLARDEGAYAQARALYVESLALRRQHDFRPAIAQSLEDLAALAARERQAERAIRLLGAAEALCETLGIQPPAAVPEEYERAVAAGRAALGEDGFAAAWAEGRAMSLDQAVGYALGDP